MKIKVLVLFLMTIAFVSCKENEEEQGAFRDGVFVVNQGPFGSGSGSLTFLDADGSAPIANVFADANSGRALGNIVQSMEEFEGNKFIAINNGSTIIVAQDGTLEFVDSITGIDQPRYFTTDNDKLFVSSWGIDGTSGVVYELSEDGEILQSNALGSGPEGMVIADGNLYVAQGGGFGIDSMLVILDADDLSLVTELTVGLNPEQVIERDNGDILVLSNGLSDFYFPENSRPGALSLVRDDAVVASVEIPVGSSRLAYDLSLIHI